MISSVQALKEIGQEYGLRGFSKDFEEITSGFSGITYSRIIPGNWEKMRNFAVIVLSLGLWRIYANRKFAENLKAGTIDRAAEWIRWGSANSLRPVNVRELVEKDKLSSAIFLLFQAREMNEGRLSVDTRISDSTGKAICSKELLSWWSSIKITDTPYNKKGVENQRKLLKIALAYSKISKLKLEMYRVPAVLSSSWIPVLKNETIQTYLNYFDNEFNKTAWKSCFEVINKEEMELILERTIEEGERIKNLDLLRFRNLSEKDLHVIIQRCPNLKVLCIHSDEIRILPILPDGFTNLHCKNSKKLEGFLNFPDSLRYIDCDGCPIKAFPMLPNDLICLSCQGTDLPSGALPENLPRNLAYIPCSGSGVLITEVRLF